MCVNKDKILQPTRVCSEERDRDRAFNVNACRARGWAKETVEGSL